MTERMHTVSIFWINDSDELLRMLDALDDPGETVGNDGCEIVVTESEMESIRVYASEHPDEIRLEEHGEISPNEARQAIEDWKDIADPRWRECE